MGEFFDSMASAERFYWYIATGASIVFIIQTVMTFIGADADTGTEADFDGNFDAGSYPFQLFSLRNLINFLLGFGWAGASLYHSISNGIILAIVSVVIGLLFVLLFFFIMKTFFRLAEDNTAKIEDAVGKRADVYTRIPADGKGKGKVLVSIQGSTRELAAITEGGKELHPGEFVKVMKVEDGVLYVMPLD